MKSKLIMLLAVLFCLGGTVQGANRVLLDVYNVTGDSIIPPDGNIFMFDMQDNPQVYKVMCSIESDANIEGISLGFEFSSSDGATWTLDDAGGFVATPNGGTFVVGVPGSRWMSAAAVDGSCWDLGGTLVNDNLAPDSFLVGGATLATGLALGPLQHMLDFHFTPTVLDGEVKTLCIDSAWYPPAGTFIFTLAGSGIITPEFQGGCYSVSYKPVSDADDNGNIPTTFSLSQNRPNPFNPATTINFSVARKTHVNISVYNVLGQRVKTLRDEDLMAGFYEAKWDGTDSGGRQVASGIYFYKMVTDDFVETRKMALMR